MCDLVVFDLDGTLVDSSTDLANATNALIDELGGARLTDEAIVGMVGEGAAVLVHRALTAASLDPGAAGVLERFLALYDTRLLETTRPYDGMIEVLESIADSGRTIAVLTNKPARASETMLDGLGLRRYFRFVVGGDTPAGRKPDPAGLLGLVEAAGTTPQMTVLVGDSPVDVQTARRAGSRVCLARYGFGCRFAGVELWAGEWSVDEPRQLIDVLRVSAAGPESHRRTSR